MWPNIQINSFSIRYKSWLLHNEMINSVWRSEKVKIYVLVQKETTNIHVNPPENNVGP
jgi:hypothetical protein